MVEGILAIRRSLTELRHIGVELYAWFGFSSTLQLLSLVAEQHNGLSASECDSRSCSMNVRGPGYFVNSSSRHNNRPPACTVIALKFAKNIVRVFTSMLNTGSDFQFLAVAQVAHYRAQCVWFPRHLQPTLPKYKPKETKCHQRQDPHARVTTNQEFCPDLTW